MDASNHVPLKDTDNTGKVALRWPKSAVVEQLIDEFEGPITGTSANVSGFPSCSGADQVMKQLGSRLPLVLDGGDTGASLPSTIVELVGEEWKVLREGAIPVTEIEKVLQSSGLAVRLLAYRRAVRDRTAGCVENARPLRPAD